jgi:hypothetical protein
VSPMERLLAEAIPDGTFGGARTLTRHQPTQPARTPDPQAAEHYAELAAVLDGWEWDEDHRNEERRRLRLITDEAA